MKHPWSIRRWSSASGYSTYACEVISQSSARSTFRGALAYLADSAPQDAAFVVVRFEGSDEDVIREAIVAANEWNLAPRLYIAADRLTLTSVDSGEIDGRRVGLMLDEVDGETPLQDLAQDRIEAVRFRTEFVHQARQNLRKSYVLDAMSGLVRDLGLCSLGPQETEADQLMKADARFDYVSDESRAAHAGGSQGNSRETAGSSLANQSTR